MINAEKTGARIKAKMQENHMTTLQLANALYLSPDAIRKWLRGAHLPNLDNMVELCAIFKCTIDDLIETEKT